VQRGAKYWNTQGDYGVDLVVKLEVRNRRGEILVEVIGTLAQVVDAAYPFMRVVNVVISVEEVRE